MKQDISNGIKHVSVYVDQMQLFVIINNVGMKINIDVNVKNQLTEHAIKDMLGILVTVNGHVICDIGKYLEYENCKCKKRLIDKLVDECNETVEEVKPAITTLAENENSYKCSSCTVYTVLFWIFFTISIGGTVAGLVYFYWYLKKYSSHADFNTYKETTIY